LVESLRSINYNGPFDKEAHDRPFDKEAHDRPFDKEAHDRPFDKEAHDRQNSLIINSKFQNCTQLVEEQKGA
jgi:hypothetical protein